MEKVFVLKDSVFRLAFLFTLRRQEAEDITQDVFLKLWNQRDVIREVSNLKAYTLKITRNICIDRKERNETYHKKVLPVVGGNLNASELLNVEERQLLNKVLHVIQDFPDHQRLIFSLRIIEGFSYEDISSITGLSAANIRMIVSRVRQELRNQFKESIYE
ncbi:MAG TPA: RNA polymerase sigma factor [Chitinophagaceae bacterium]|nr:RNA polymerase sigma factor [Chitinophagaceae bacterium]